MPISDSVFTDKSIAKLTVTDEPTEFRDGDFLLCSGSGPFSELIKAATNSAFSHVAMILYLQILDKWMVVESVESFGVRAVTLKSYVSDYCGTGKGYPGDMVIARHDDISAEMLADGKLTGFAVDALGHPYDKTEIIKIAAHIATAGLLNEGKFQEAKKYICSEYAAACYKQIGIEIKRGERSFIAPADFASDPKIKAVGLLHA